MLSEDNWQRPIKLEHTRTYNTNNYFKNALLSSKLQSFELDYHSKLESKPFNLFTTYM